MLGREFREREQIVFGGFEEFSCSRMGPGEHRDDLSELSMHRLSLAAWHKNRANDRRHHLRRNLRNPCEHVAHEMYPAPLPRTALERDLDRANEASVRVTDD